MGAFIDLKGRKFGQLMVIKRGPNLYKDKRVSWICFCSCGTEKIVGSSQLQSGDTRSCGCLRRSGLKRITHGLSDTKGYFVWYDMMRRCYNKKSTNYRYYGGRGIKVCRRWHDLKLFITDMGQPPPGLTIERKNNDRGYFLKNCRWATRKEQANNKRDSSECAASPS